MLSFAIYHNPFLVEFEKLSLPNLLPTDPITERKSRAEQQALLSMPHCSRKLQNTTVHNSLHLILYFSFWTSFCIQIPQKLLQMMSFQSLGTYQQARC